MHLALFFDCDATIFFNPSTHNTVTPSIKLSQFNNNINKAIVDVLRGLDGFPETPDPYPGDGPCHTDGKIVFSKKASLWLAERLIHFSALKFRQYEILLEFQDRPFSRNDPRVKELKNLHRISKKKG